MFSWSGKSRYPGQRASTTASSSSSSPPGRQQHLDSYLKDDMLQRSTRKVSPDDSTYDTVFQTVHGDTLILRVHLQQKHPSMSLAGVTARHAWLDEAMRVVGYAPIRSEQAWQDSRLLLGPAVRQVVEHFQLHPPEIVEIVDSNLQQIQSRTSSTKGASSQLRTMPRHIPQLDALSHDQLEVLLEDRAELMAFCHSLPVLKDQMEDGHDDNNLPQAKDNLQHETTLKTLHAEVTQLQSQVQSKLQTFRTLEQEQDALCQPPDLRALAQELHTLKKQSLDQSERMAEDWLDDAGPVDAFLRTFLEERTLHHRRAALLELLQHQS